ncbi:Aste57867_15930 [Aphanomyces stellatus]|uniref:Aste57867_15930 protein n=1 Tax=Aphanomyces stellatus TaxID=120398 RepID=A0A485L587_9STRA|nr:hypothetical protein As57867_015874 [Aphanomyces stellatus]VFT92716.1 Aste57867_15930 [Aphanomyces stellatus]
MSQLNRLRQCSKQFRRITPSARRFNTSANPQGPGATQGTNSGRPRGDYEWARHANEFAKTFSEFSTNAYVHTERQWRYKGPLWGFGIGALAGYLSRPDNGTAEVENRRLKSLARDLQDETRELKVQLAAVQQSIDALRGLPQAPSLADHAHRKRDNDESIKRHALACENEFRKLEERMNNTDDVAEALKVAVDIAAEVGRFIALALENEKMKKDEQTQTDDATLTIRDGSGSLVQVTSKVE